MHSVAINFTPLIVTVSLAFFFSVITLQGLSLVIEGSVAKRLPTIYHLSPLCQNLGVACAILGLTFAETSMTAVGVLLIAFGLVSSSGRFFPLHPAIELPLLISALLSLLTLGAFRFFL